MTKTVDSALADYIKACKAEESLIQKHEEALEKIKTRKEKITAWILEQDTESTKDYDQDQVDLNPFLFWKALKKTDASAVTSARMLREKITVSNNEAKVFEEEHKEQLETIKQWILAELNARGSKGFNCGDLGQAYKQIKTKASAVDFNALIAWASENQAESIVQRRLNSTFINQYFDDHGEYPPFIDVIREYDVVIRK